MTADAAGGSRPHSFRDYPIQRKLMALLLVASAVALVLAAIGVVVYEVTTIRPRVVRDLQTQAELLQVNTAAALSFDDQVAAAENLTTLQAKPEIVAAALYDAAGQAFAVYRRDGAPARVPATAPPPGSSGSGSRLVLATRVHPANAPEEALGTLVLWYELPPLVERLPQYSIMVTVVLLALATMAALVTSMHRTALTQPLAALAQTAREVTRTRNYAARASKHGDDEIGGLTDAVNAMLGAVEERDRALRLNAARLRNVLEAARMTTWSWSPDGDRVRWGEQSVDMFGGAVIEQEQTLEAFLGMVHDDDRVRLSSLLERSLAEAQPGSTVFRIVARDGSERCFELQAWPGSDDDPNGPGLIGLVQDVTERERTEEARRTWADAVEHASLGIAISDPSSGLVRYANAAFAALYGLELEAIRGRPIRGLYAPSAWDEAQPRIAIADTEGSVTFESRHRRADDSEFPVTISLTTVKDEEGRPRYRIANVKDMTEQQRLEEQFRQAQKMEAVGRLAGGIAHDFNNLLTGIEGYSDFALRALEPDHPARADVAEIRQIGKRAAALTQQLLAFSRRQVLQPSLIDPSELVRRSSRLLERLLGENIRVVIRTEATAALVRIDPGQLEQALVNLGVNARDAMPDGGSLTLETRVELLTASDLVDAAGLAPGEYVVITATDSGHGMPPEVLERIFEPFYTTKEVGKGTGLGLAQVFGLIKQSGGHVVAQSSPGEGTSIRILLPRARGVPVPLGAASPEAVEGGSETVLLVEDQPQVLELAARELRALGYRVLECSSPAAAQEIVERADERIDVLVTDLIMPGGNGSDLAELVVRLRPGIGVLYMSGYPDPAVAPDGLLRAGRAFLQKPFTREQLAAKLREALESR